MNVFVKLFMQGFIKGAQETPKAYFAPLIALWRLMYTTTKSVIDDERQRSRHRS